MMTGAREINCVGCGSETFVRVDPVYDGFKRTGEVFVCVSCGHKYGSEAELPLKQGSRPTVFSEADRSKVVNPFESDGPVRNCRHCVNYVVNPFTQRCGLDGHRINATDCCGRFEAADQALG